jgi:tetratricopeptide (TPR) repeat protein
MRNLLFVCIALLCASDVTARAADPGHFEVAFADGIWAFGRNDNVSAVEHFQEAARLRPDYGFSLYLLGLSHLRLGMAREAAQEIAASLAAKEPPPVERSRVLADLGAAQLAAGDFQAAIGTLEKALPERQTDAVAFYDYAKALRLAGRREEAEAALAKARLLDPKLDPDDLPVSFPAVTAQPGSGGEPRWTGSVGVLAGHDSNPNLLAEDLLLPIPSQSSSSNPKLVSGRTGDSVASADLRLSRRPIPLGGGWTLAADLREEGSFHRDLQYLNVIRTGAVVHLAHGTDPGGALEGPLGWAEVPEVPADSRSDRKFSVLFQGGLDELRLDNASYLRISALAGSVTYAVSPDDAMRLDLHFQDREYYRHPLADPRRNGQEVGAGVHKISYLGSRDRTLTIGFEASDRHAGSAFARTLLGGDVEAVLPFGRQWTVRLAGWVNRENFDDPASNLFSTDPASPARRDTTWGSSAELAFDISARLRFLLRGGYQHRDSNVTFDAGAGGVPALDYRRTLVETGLSWAF